MNYKRFGITINFGYALSKYISKNNSICDKILISQLVKYSRKTSSLNDVVMIEYVQSVVTHNTLYIMDRTIKQIEFASSNTIIGLTHILNIAENTNNDYTKYNDYDENCHAVVNTIKEINAVNNNKKN